MRIETKEITIEVNDSILGKFSVEERKYIQRWLTGIAYTIAGSCVAGMAAVDLHFHRHYEVAKELRQMCLKGIATQKAQNN